MPLVPVFQGQRQADLCEFKASLVYIASFRTAKAIKTVSQAGEMAQRLRSLTALPEFNSQQPHGGDLMPSFLACRCTCKQNTGHIIDNKENI